MRTDGSSAAGSQKNTDEETVPRKDSGQGILKRTAAADCGLVETPVLAPHLEFRAVDDRQVLLVSETFNTLLRGRIHPDLLPLLDGRRSRRDIVAALGRTHSETDVQGALVSLASRGYLVSGEYAMERGQAAFWSSLGASPRWAEERLGAVGVAVAGDDGRLARPLAAMGVAVEPDARLSPFSSAPAIWTSGTPT